MASIAIISVAVAIGAIIQGSIGFGYALVAMPSLVLLLPSSVPVTPLLLALELLPGLLVGLWASRWVVERLKERWLRPAVLTFAAVAGVVIVLLGPGG